MGDVLDPLRRSKSANCEATPPPGLTKLNDSVWKLHSPPNGEAPQVEIIFFHGLQVDGFQDAFWKTWLAVDNDQLVWPKDWLREKLPKARILSVSYNSSVTEHSGQTDMFTLGENLVQDIILSRKNQIGQECPVILVGHCLGGIVIKHFILMAIAKKLLMNSITDQSRLDRINKFLDNFKGAFFYATPHNGSPAITRFARGLQKPSPILNLLKTLDTNTGRINSEFANQRVNWDAKTFGIGELLPTTTFLGFHGTIVLEASARHDLDDYYTHATADHFTVCKARNRKDPTVIEKLVEFITKAAPPGTIMRTQ